MAISLSVPPVGIAGLAAVSPAALRPLLASTSAGEVAAFDGGSSIVRISGTGLLLAATSSFVGELRRLQGVGDAPAADVVAQAEGLVDAFNDLQSSVSGVQSLFDALAVTSPTDPRAQFLDDLAATVASRDLATLGIQAQSPAPGAGNALVLDRNALADAVAADPAGAAAIVDRAIQSLIDDTTGFETQFVNAALGEAAGLPAAIAGATPAASDLPVPDALTPLPIAAPLDDLLTEALAGEIRLTGLGLASAQGIAGLVAATSQRPDTAALNPAGPAPATAAATTPATAIPGPLAPTAAAAPVAPLAPVAPTLTAPAPLRTVPAADNRDAYADRIALQALLSDPAMRARDVFLDPAFAAVIGASRLSDFVLPTPTFAPQGPPDDVQPVLRIARVEPLVSYMEAAYREPRPRVNVMA